MGCTCGQNAVSLEDGKCVVCHCDCREQLMFSAPEAYEQIIIKEELAKLAKPRCTWCQGYGIFKTTDGEAMPCHCTFPDYIDEMKTDSIDIVVESKDEKIARLTKALEEIREFGRVNAGCGYTCAKMAQKALEE